MISCKSYTLQINGWYPVWNICYACHCNRLFRLIWIDSLTVQNRLKEIGIRKVLGASVIDITSLISADFVKLVIVSFVISSPVAWYLMTNWLQSFAYRIDIHWWVFLIACGIAIVISLVTLSFQSIKAAIANPVKSFKERIILLVIKSFAARH